MTNLIIPAIRANGGKTYKPDMLFAKWELEKALKYKLPKKAVIAINNALNAVIREQG